MANWILFLGYASFLLTRSFSYEIVFLKSTSLPLFFLKMVQYYLRAELCPFAVCVNQAPNCVWASSVLFLLRIAPSSSWESDFWKLDCQPSVTAFPPGIIRTWGLILSGIMQAVHCCVWYHRVITASAGVAPGQHRRNIGHTCPREAGAGLVMKVANLWVSLCGLTWRSSLLPQLNSN